MSNRLQIYEEINNRLKEIGADFCVKPANFFVAECPQNFGLFELATRTCYDSHNKICPGSDLNLFERIMRKGHTAAVEFLPMMTVRAFTDRGVSHEMVRHRLCSFMQASTRYITYDTVVPFIMPWSLNPEGFLDFLMDYRGKHNTDYCLFYESCATSSRLYKSRLGNGQSAQEARGTLNNETATTIWVKTNIREWLTILILRSAPDAHPNFRIQACGLLKVATQKMPFIFTEKVMAEQKLAKNIEWFENEHDLFCDGDVYHIIPKVVG